MAQRPPTPSEYAHMYWSQQQHAAKLLEAQRDYLREFEANLLAEFRRRLDAATEHLNGIYGNPEAIRHRREANDEIAAHHARKREQRHNAGRASTE